MILAPTVRSGRLSPAAPTPRGRTNWLLIFLVMNAIQGLVLFPMGAVAYLMLGAGAPFWIIIAFFYLAWGAIAVAFALHPKTRDWFRP